MPTSRRAHAPLRHLLSGLAVPGVVAALLAPAVAGAGAPPRSAPTVAPDRVALVPAPDPATAQAMTWRTTDAVTAGTVQAQPAAGGAPRSAPATSTSRGTTTGYRHRFHRATLTGLAPGTRYRYRVGSAAGWSAWETFTTSSSGPTATSFIAMGDVQKDHRGTWAAVAARALADRPAASAWVQAGDLVDDHGHDPQWDDLFDAAGALPRRMSVLTVVGNHEYAKADPATLAPQWRAQFPYATTLAGRSPVERALAGTVWTTRIDGVRFVGLNGYYRLPASAADERAWLDVQARWLARVLAADRSPWRVVVFHYPVYSSSPGRGNPELRRAWQPVFERHGVDLVLQGHDHAYVRGQRDVPGEDTGPVYVTSSASSRQYRLSTRDWVASGAAVAKAVQGVPVYQVVDVDGARLSYAAKDAAGRVVDAFTMTKSGGTRRVRPAA